MKSEADEIARLRQMTHYETAIYGNGFQVLAGLDEAGRGPIAGPVVAAAVIMPPDRLIPGVDDSKKLTEAARVRLAKQIKKEALDWAIGIIAPPLLDDINIYQATRLAMTSAVQALQHRPDHLIIDAMRLPALRVAQTPLIKGDSLSFLVACASILAKTERDSIMDGLDALYPGYGFRKHKGYYTPHHREALERLGPCEMHRRSFEPVKTMVGGGPVANQCGLFDKSIDEHSSSG